MFAPFPYFGGKRTIVDEVWSRFGKPLHYIEPFCGSAAILLGAPKPAALEVVGDMSGFIANFWRACSMQPDEVARWADYPVSHVDLHGRHKWLMDQRVRVAGELEDPNHPGDAKVAGWWLWGQCCWIGSGWCDWEKASTPKSKQNGRSPHVGNAGRGVRETLSKIPHVSDAGRGVQALGQIPHVSDAGRGVQALGQIPHVSNAGMGVRETLSKIGQRLARVRAVHGSWSRTLNLHYGKGPKCAVFFDPPYVDFESLYGAKDPVTTEVVAWCKDHQHESKIAICGHIGDYDLPGWDVWQWKRAHNTYAGTKTKDKECVWFSPLCDKPTVATENEPLFQE